MNPSKYFMLTRQKFPRGNYPIISRNVFQFFTNYIFLFMTHYITNTTLSKSSHNIGGTEAQIILLSQRVLELNRHLQTHKKDYSSLRGLKKILGQRKRLLNYLSKNDLWQYQKMIELIKKTKIIKITQNL
jgi:small subunit ribosomal protein S15